MGIVGPARVRHPPAPPLARGLGTPAPTRPADVTTTISVAARPITALGTPLLARVAWSSPRVPTGVAVPLGGPGPDRPGAHRHPRGGALSPGGGCAPSPGAGALSQYPRPAWPVRTVKQLGRGWGKLPGPSHTMTLFA